LRERVNARTLKQRLRLLETTEAEESQPENEVRALEVWNPGVSSALGAHACERSLE
jgi:hypothetical protein